MADQIVADGRTLAKFIVKVTPRFNKSFYGVASIPYEIKGKIKVPKFQPNRPIFVADYGGTLKKYNSKQVKVVGYPIQAPPYEQRRLCREYFLENPVKDFFKITDHLFFIRNPLITIKTHMESTKLIFCEMFFDNVLITRTVAAYDHEDTFNYFSCIKEAVQRLCRSKATF